jgi:prepilin signal peptidase PulO-like enzyme (type II secretory pathway)
MLTLLSFIYGASIGSFVQVVASRLHVAPITKGRSKCLSCGETLRVLDLIPLFSYVLLRGKCRYCKSKYGVSSLIVELLFGVTFTFLYLTIVATQFSLALGVAWLSYYTILFGVLGVMALYDRAHSYVPPYFLLGYLVLTFLMYGNNVLRDSSFMVVLGPVFVALPFLIIWLTTKGKGLGFGDVILFVGVGAFFGTLQGLAVLMISVWIGALVGLFIKYTAKKKKTGPTPMPFVPFIVVAFLIVLFTGIDVLSIAMLGV